MTESSRWPGIDTALAGEGSGGASVTMPVTFVEGLTGQALGTAEHPIVMTVSGGSDAVIYAERTFTETTGPGTYTATVDIPVGGSVLDVRWTNQALWTATTSATLNVGDADDADGYIIGVSTKAAPVADVNGAGGISTLLSSTGTGAYKGLTKRYATGGTVTATVVTVGAAGNAGRSRLIVVYAVPTATPAATKA